MHASGLKRIVSNSLYNFHMEVYSSLECTSFLFATPLKLKILLDISLFSDRYLSLKWYKKYRVDLSNGEFIPLCGVHLKYKHEQNALWGALDMWIVKIIV